MHKIEIPDWAVARGRNMNNFDTIDPRRTAVVVIDMQTVFMEPDEVFGNQNALDIVPAVNRAVRTLRNAVAHGINVKIVADRATDAPSYGFDPLLLVCAEADGEE